MLMILGLFCRWHSLPEVIADGGGFVGVASALLNRGDVRSGFGVSIDVGGEL
jgi:hypothetical protein